MIDMMSFYPLFSDCSHDILLSSFKRKWLVLQVSFTFVLLKGYFS